jgi:hypothetical protein
MITSQDRLQHMDERRLPHQGARNSIVDQGYPSDGVFLLLHLWAPSNGMRDSALLHQGYAPWSRKFPRRIPCGCLPTLR